MKDSRIYKSLKSGVIAMILFVPILFSSCKYLEVDYYFDDTMKFDSIFINYENLSAYMWTTSNLFPDEGNVFVNPYTPGVLATDEAFSSFKPADHAGLSYVLGGINADNISGSRLNVWTNMYKVIRKCNTILARKQEANLTALQEEEITGYTHMLRGYAYYHLIQSYGPCVIVGDEVFPGNEDEEVYNHARATFDESVDYCCQELEEAAKYLPTTIPSSSYGRPSRGAAFALIARLRIQQASPLYNGGVGESAATGAYGTWKRKVDGVNYISQIYDERKWAVAAAACKRVMDMGLYALHTVMLNQYPTENPRKLPENVDIPDRPFPYGANDIDCFHSYADMFNGETLGSKNPEFIWGRSSNMGGLIKCCFPLEQIMGGYNGFCVTQKLVDAFYMADGRDIKDASDEYPYHIATGSVTDDYFSKSAQSFSGYTIPEGVYGMYLNRENRFYVTVGFSGRRWEVKSNSQSIYGPFNVWFNQTSEDNSNIYSGKNASRDNPLNYPATGYLLTKYIHPEDACNGNGATVMTKYFPIIRYAEILLSYAEALNHLTQGYTIELPSAAGGNQALETYTVSRDPAEIMAAFNQIRYRVGLPGLSSLPDETTFDNIIKREFMIEFACENRRYYDVRRWGIYLEEERKGIYGMHAGGDKSEFYQTPLPVQQVNNRNRVIEKKLILLPISKKEIRRTKDLDQNLGWEG